MTKLEQSARQALDALEVNLPVGYCMNGVGDKSPIYNSYPLREIKTQQAITALREALAEQAEQEPMAWILTEADGTMDFDCQPTIKPTQNDYDALREGETFTPLYAAPVRTKDLTDDEIMKCDERICANTEWGRKKMFARAVIAADRSKNGIV